MGNRPLAPLENNSFFVNDVVQGVTYEIYIRAVAASGRTSHWVYATHTVVGKVNPPPDVQSFDVVRLGDGTRSFIFVLGTIPPDIDGVLIRYGPGGTGGWADLVPLHLDVLDGSSPQELNVPPGGYWRFGIKMIDTSGNESVNAIFVDRTLGPPRQDGYADSEDCKLLRWPGVRVGCYMSQDFTLCSEGNGETWGTIPATWAGWTNWTINPTSPISYTHTPVDIEAVLNVEVDAYVVTDGDAVVEFRYSTDNITYTAWADISTGRGVTQHGRYFQFRITVTANGGNPIPIIREFALFMRAPTQIFEVGDVNTAGLDAQHRYGPGDVRIGVPAGQFQLIRTVGVGFNGVGDGWTWDLVDKDAATGPRVRLYNNQGVLADATIDVTIRGI